VSHPWRDLGDGVRARLIQTDIGWMWDLSFPLSINASAPADDEVRLLVEAARAESGDPDDAFWVHAELQCRGADVPIEVVQGVLDGL
jgi:hypothetical protein